MNHISITDQIAKLDDRRYRDGIDDKEYWTQVNAIYTDSGSPYAWLIKRLLEVQPGYLVLPEQPVTGRIIASQPLLQELTGVSCEALNDRLISFDCTGVNTKLRFFMDSHGNSAKAWLEGSIEDIGSGFCYWPSGKWTQHSWGMNRKGTIVELTSPDPAAAYFGLTLTADESGRLTHLWLEDCAPYGLACVITARKYGEQGARYHFENDEQREELLAIINEEPGWESWKSIDDVNRRIRQLFSVDFD
jgi:hypothetical protein